MKEVGPDGSIHVHNLVRDVSYRPEFKDWVEGHKQAMAKVVEIIEKMVKKEALEKRTVENNGNIQVVRMRNRYSDLFEVSVGPDKFFVKRDQIRMNIPGYHPVGGHLEYEASAFAKERVKNDPDIEIIEFMLGYTRKNGDKTFGYFVSKWEDLHTVEDFLAGGNLDKSKELSEQEKEELEHKVERVKILFSPSEYRDVGTYNMFYDPKTKKIKLFDLNINPEYPFV